MQEKVNPCMGFLKRYWFFIVLCLAVLTAAIVLDQFIWCNLVTVLDMNQCTLLGQSAWEWLKLLIGPVIATIGGIFLNQYFKTRDNKRRELEKQIEEDRLRQNALVSYFDQMTQLFLSSDWPQSNGKIEKNSTNLPIIAFAKARTFALLNELDSKRKGSLILFLFEAKALRFLSLRRSNLHNAYLHKAKLYNTDLHRADLQEADLSEADLYKANLYKAKLNGANLHETNLYKTKLYKTDLHGANLEKAKLSGTYGITVDQIKQAKNWEQGIYSKDFRQKLGLPPHPITRPTPRRTRVALSPAPTK